MIRPGDAAAMINLAAINDPRGRRTMVSAKRVAMTAAVDARVFINLGNQRERGGGDGGPIFRRAVVCAPSEELGYRRLATSYVNREDPVAGERVYRRALQCDGRSTASLLGLGNLLRRAGRLSEAHDRYAVAARLRPGDWQPDFNLGLCLLDAGNTQAAARVFRAALWKSPDPAEPLDLLARHYLDLGQPGPAAVLCQKALLLIPGSVELLANLARSIIGKDREWGSRLFRQAQCTVGMDGLALSDLAGTLWDAGEHEASRGLLERAVVALPGQADPHANLARALNRLWYGRPALRSARRAAILDPTKNRHWSLIALAHTRFAETNTALLNYWRGRIACADSVDYISAELFTLLYAETVSADAKADRHRALAKDLMSGALARRNSPPETPNLAGARRKRGGGTRSRDKIRIGYVSPDLAGNHPVALFTRPLFAHHDRERFSVHVYESNETSDQTTATLAASTDGWRHVRGWRTDRIIKAIRDDEIDVLVDLSGHTAGNRLDVFAARAAPVQVSFIGYPHSTGLPAMTHLLADNIVAPRHHEHLFTEDVVRLPGCVFCVDPDTLPVPIDPAPVEQRRQIVFGSFNNFPKIGHDTIALWARVLDAVPGSILRLKAASFRDPELSSHCRRLFDAHGITGDRLTLTGPSGFEELLSEYAEIDIALDPRTYNGGTTTCQALWMGVPVVTLAGGNFCGRMGASILGHAGLDRWIAQTEARYVEIAVALAKSRRELITLRRGLRDRLLKTSFADTTGYVTSVESAYKAMALSRWRK